MVPFEPRTQTGLALGYALSPTGPRYEICEHDWDFDPRMGWGHTLQGSRTLGILERINMDELSPPKVRNFKALLTLVERDWGRYGPPVRQYWDEFEQMLAGEADEVEAKAMRLRRAGQAEAAARLLTRFMDANASLALERLERLIGELG